MNILALKSCIVTVAAVLCPMLAHSVPITFGGKNNLNQLTLIGTIEGKSYFTEENTIASWQDAKAICESSGLHLATITSVAQSTLIKSASNNVTFTGTHWVGARDSLKPTQFSWGNNGEMLSSTVIDPYSPEDGMLTCLCFNPEAKIFYGKACGAKYKILCELAHGRNPVEFQ